MSWTVWAVLGVGLGATWHAIANTRTCSQRTEIVNTWGPCGAPKWHVLYGEYGQVSYERHLWTVFTLRDYRKLYGPETRKLLERDMSIGWNELFTHQTPPDHTG